VFYESCPEQLNGFDCGIFAVAVCLHLSEQKPVDRTSFAQSNATSARRLLSGCLGDPVVVLDKAELVTIGRYFRLCFPLLSVNTLTIGGVVGGVPLETNSVPPLRARKSTPTKMKQVQDKISATKRVNREVKLKEKKKLQNVMMLTRNALKTRGGTTIASVVNDDDDDYHPSDSDADIVDTTTEKTKVGLSLTKELLAKSPRKESIDLDDCVEVLVEDAANRLIEGKPYPNEVVINPMSTSLKTEDTSSTLSGLSLDTTFYKVMADAHVESFAEIDHIEPLVEIYEQKLATTCESSVLSMGNFVCINAGNTSIVRLRFVSQGARGMVCMLSPG
jgi:hypothetical protein